VRISKKNWEKIKKGVVYIILSAGGVLMIAPLVWTVSTSLKTLPQLNIWPPALIPDPIAWENYPKALTILPFALYFRNTITVTVFVLIGHLISCSLVAYGFARLRFPGRDILFIVMLGTIMVPFVVTLIPLFIIFSRIGWINTFLPLIIPGFLGYPVYVFLLQQFFKSIPMDIADAAKLDGCSEINIWWRIMLPLSKPVLTVIAVFSIQFTWNDFLGPLIYLQKPQLRTMALGLYYYRNMPGQLPMFHYLMAISVVMVIPMLVLFAFFQRYFIHGVILTGIKR
jgi:ABC-type glycerol-3-phosphate transport system permease component